MDLSKLSDEQLAIAMKVAEEAKRQGINPDFVLPMVMIESGFNQNQVSKKGAIGVMQLLPGTAEYLKVDPNDVDQNISGGIKYLKELIGNKNIGGDPNKVLIGYNAGPGSSFFKTGSMQDIPDETLNHIVKVSGVYGGELPTLAYQAPAQEEQKAGVVPALPTAGQPVASGTTSAPGTTGTPTPSVEIPLPLAGLAGGVTGAAAGAKAGISKAKLDAATEAYDMIKNRIAGATGNAPAPAEGSTPGGKWGAKTGYGIGEGTVEESSSAYKRAVPQGKVSSRMAKMYGIKKPGESPELVQRLIDRAKAREAVQAADMALRSRFSPAMSYMGRLLSFPLKGAAYGAGTAMSAADVYNRIQEGDKTGAGISAAGGLSGLAAPFVASAGALPAAAVAAPLYLAASDRIKYLEKHPEDYKLEESNIDPMGNVIR